MPDKGSVDAGLLLAGFWIAIGRAGEVGDFKAFVVSSVISEPVCLITEQDQGKTPTDTARIDPNWFGSVIRRT